MAQLLVRNIDERTKQRLKKRAQRHGRSLEGEVREILREAAAESAPPKPLMFGTKFHSHFKDIGVDLELPPKQYPRGPDFEE